MSAPCETYLHLRPGVSLGTNDTELRLFRRDPWPLGEPFGAPDPVKRAVLEKLATGPCARSELLDMAGIAGARGDGVGAFLDALGDGGWLETAVRWQGRDLYTMQPVRTSSGAPGSPAAPDAQPGDPVLSRFAVLRREGDQLLVESPLARAQMLVHAPDVTALIGTLARPATEPRASGPLPAGVRDQVLRDLVEAGLLVSADAESGPDVSLWRPHDLWMHARSRSGNGGYCGAGFGRTGWGEHVREPVPARREPFPGPAVELYRPDVEALRDSDRSLTAAVEDRRSIRAHDDESPITADQLGELLYRCARTRNSVTRDGVEYLSRPHPAGGGAYELELYPVLRRVSGLAQGMYHYDSHEHRLCLVRAPGPEVARLVQNAAAAAMAPAPQVLIVVAARFGRLMWTYEELAYALVLKHVGVLYQTMYLVATSMGLAGCALGAGDAVAFTEATGLDYTAESSVGEFMLGSAAREVKR